jgi:hypothetical protein
VEVDENYQHIKIKIDLYIYRCTTTYAITSKYCQHLYSLNNYIYILLAGLVVLFKDFFKLNAPDHLHIADKPDLPFPGFQDPFVGSR